MGNRIVSLISYLTLTVLQVEPFTWAGQASHGSLGGVVREQRGNPVPGVRIEALSPEGDRRITETGEGGAFRLEGLPVGKGYTVIASAPCFPTIGVSPVVVSASSLTVQNFTLPSTLYAHTSDLRLGLTPRERARMGEEIDWIAQQVCIPPSRIGVDSIQPILARISALPPKLAAGADRALHESLRDTISSEDPVILRLLASGDARKEEVAIHLLYSFTYDGRGVGPELVPILERLANSEELDSRLRTMVAEVLHLGPLQEDVEGGVLVLVGRLTHIAASPGCGGYHFGGVATYTDLEIVEGEYQHRSVEIIHGCPELSREDYAEGSGDLREFRAGDYHRLTLVDTRKFEGVVVEGKGKRTAPRYYCEHVALERESHAVD